MVLLNYDLLAIPTETVYGLAAIATADDAVAQVFSLKQRPLSHPLILHIAKDWDITQWACGIPEYAFALMDAFWPGPLTLVLPVREGSVSPLVNAGQKSIAIRCPAHPVTQALLQRINVPVVAPSANAFGKLSPTTAQHVAQNFSQSSLTVLDGGRCKIGIESTIVSTLEPLGWRILRPGMLHAHALEKVAPQSQQETPEQVRVSGDMAAHYQPERPLYYFEEEALLHQFVAQSAAAIFVISATAPKHHPPHLYARLSRDAKKTAYELYFQLRLADTSGAAAIAMVLPSPSSETLGIRERIAKAGKQHPDF